MELTNDIMYQALYDKDPGFEGVFFAAVKTTGIFCRPTCTARKPKKENTEFFKTSKEALLKGYRPCKVCSPLEKYRETPDFIKEVLKELSENPSEKLSDYDLFKRGIEPSKMRRWFMKNHGITFQSYQRMYRINSAFKKIHRGESVTSAAYDSGFESVSGFTDRFKTVFGVSPNKSRSRRVIDLKRIETILGTMYVCAVDEGVCLLEFTDRRMLETSFLDLAKRLNATIVQGESKHFVLLEKELQEYFEGSRQVFTVPLFTPGSAFQQKVWQALQAIPFAKTVSYKDQAHAIGMPDAVRAVANANGKNRVSIIIPCHRVVGSDGQLTGYGGGVWRKKALLELEEKYAGEGR